MAEYMAKALKQDKEDWMTKKWRPMMAIVYMLINLFDFIIGPILYNLLQYWNPGQAIGMWQPLTLQGGGLIHIAFGAILGISAWTRGQEKVASINNGLDPNGYAASPTQPQWIDQSQQFQQPMHQPMQQPVSYAPPSPSSYDMGDTVQTTTVQQTRSTPRRKIV
jgi:hypothetical protein